MNRLFFTENNVFMNKIDLYKVYYQGGNIYLHRDDVADVRGQKLKHLQVAA